MSAPSDGARADARKARVAQVEEGHGGRCEREYTENGFIFIDCLCSLRREKAEAWDEGHRFTGYAPAPGENPYRSESGR